MCVCVSVVFSSFKLYGFFLFSSLFFTCLFPIHTVISFFSVHFCIYFSFTLPHSSRLFMVNECFSVFKLIFLVFCFGMFCCCCFVLWLCLFFKLLYCIDFFEKNGYDANLTLARAHTPTNISNHNVKIIPHIEYDFCRVCDVYERVLKLHCNIFFLFSFCSLILILK